MSTSSFDINMARSGLIDWLQSTTMLRSLHAQLGRPIRMEKTLPEMLGQSGELLVERAMLPREKTKPQSQMCYLNAWELKCEHDRSGGTDGKPLLTYCEGYVVLEKVAIPVMHGFCVDEKGRVHDPSVDQDEGALYVGWRFDDELARNAWTQLDRQRLIGILPNIEFVGLDLDTEISRGRVWAAKPLRLEDPALPDIPGLSALSSPAKRKAPGP